jgi:hypothetical protein
MYLHALLSYQCCGSKTILSGSCLTAKRFGPDGVFHNANDFKRLFMAYFSESRYRYVRLMHF